MAQSVTRRDFVTAGVALLTTQGLTASKADITIGITVDTRPDWSGPQNFMRSIQEASEVGYHWSRRSGRTFPVGRRIPRG